MANEVFEREKLCYVQNFEQARSLNTQMNRVPVLSMTLTGGLWFGAALTENVDNVIQFALLLFAGICNLALILTAFRIRDVMQSYLEKVSQFHKPMFVAGHPKNPKLGEKFGGYSMISTYSVLMFMAAVLSIIGAFFFYWPFSTSNYAGLIIFLLLMVIAYLSLIHK